MMETARNTTDTTNKTILEKYQKVKRIKFIVALLGSSTFWIIVAVIFFLILIIGAAVENSATTDSEGMYGVGTSSLPEEVLTWKSIVEEICAEEGMSDYVPYVLGIIAVETGGRIDTSRDIMQSSESKGLAPNTISDPEESIKAGVQLLKGIKEDAKSLGVSDMNAVIQSYNFGRYYVTWLATNNKSHSLEVAEGYSKSVVAPANGNSNAETIGYSHPIAVAYNGGYRYKSGGNFFYADLVRSYLTFSGELPEGSELFQSIMTEAMKYEGNPYVWGGKNPSAGFDCSGLTYWAYQTVGVTIPINAAGQYSFVTKVDIKDAKAGDLIFFKGTYGGPSHISHVGIYIDQNTMYDSNSGGIGYTTWSSGYWYQHFAGIGRVQ